MSTPPINSAQLGAIDAIMFGLRYVEGSKTWLVVVSPEEYVETTRRILVGLLSNQTKFSGRTAALPGGGRLSVVGAAEDVFIPKGIDFAVM